MELKDYRGVTSIISHVLRMKTATAINKTYH